MKICQFNDEVPCIDCGMYCSEELQREANISFCDKECLCKTCKYEEL